MFNPFFMVLGICQCAIIFQTLQFHCGRDSCCLFFYQSAHFVFLDESTVKSLGQGGPYIMDYLGVRQLSEL